MLKVVYFGTPDLSAEILSDLIKHRRCEIVGVVTRPDKPKGRSKRLEPSPVKKVALEHGIPLLQGPRCHSPEALEWLQSRQADLFLVIAFGEILKQSVLDLPPRGCWNVHASILPYYRGAAPMHWALRNGETETGVTIQRMALACDAGDVALEAKIPVPNSMTAGELKTEMVAAAKPLLARFFTLFEADLLELTPQDASLVTWAPKIEKADCKLEWNQSAQRLHNLVRASNPEPGAYAEIQQGNSIQKLGILKTVVHSEVSDLPVLSPGESALHDRRWWVGTGDGLLELITVQPEGKSIMGARDYLNGLRGIPPRFLREKG
jgi:methionyl-tRNA formyltransferase